MKITYDLEKQIGLAIGLLKTEHLKTYKSILKGGYIVELKNNEIFIYDRNGKIVFNDDIDNRNFKNNVFNNYVLYEKSKDKKINLLAIDENNELKLFEISSEGRKNLRVEKDWVFLEKTDKHFLFNAKTLKYRFIETYKNIQDVYLSSFSNQNYYIVVENAMNNNIAKRITIYDKNLRMVKEFINTNDFKTSIKNSDDGERIILKKMSGLNVYNDKIIGIETKYRKSEIIVSMENGNALAFSLEDKNKPIKQLRGAIIKEGRCDGEI